MDYIQEFLLCELLWNDVVWSKHDRKDKPDTSWPNTSEEDLLKKPWQYQLLYFMEAMILRYWRALCAASLWALLQEMPVPWHTVSGEVESSTKHWYRPFTVSSSAKCKQRKRLRTKIWRHQEPFKILKDEMPVCVYPKKLQNRWDALSAVLSELNGTYSESHCNKPFLLFPLFTFQTALARIQQQSQNPLCEN